MTTEKQKACPKNWHQHNVNFFLLFIARFFYAFFPRMTRTEFQKNCTHKSLIFKRESATYVWKEIKQQIEKNNWFWIEGATCWRGKFSTCFHKLQRETLSYHKSGFNHQSEMCKKSRKGNNSFKLLVNEMKKAIYVRTKSVLQSNWKVSKCES